MLAFSYRIGPDPGAFLFVYGVDPFEEEGGGGGSGGALFFGYRVQPRVSEDEILVVPAQEPPAIVPAMG